MTRAKCNICLPETAWQSVPIATRLQKHLMEKHKLSIKFEITDSCSSSPPPSSIPQIHQEPQQEPAAEAAPQLQPSPRSQSQHQHSPGQSPTQSPAAKKARILDFCDRSFTSAEQAAAERAQALYVVMNGHSYHSQQRHRCNKYLNFCAG